MAEPRPGDVRVTPGPGAPRGLVIPAGELVERFSHASGPGGQGVNTADSRVQLSLDLAATSALDDVQRARVLARLAPRLAGTVLTVKGKVEGEPFKEEAFFEALMRIWLGPKPADWQLKDALLGVRK